MEPFTPPALIGSSAQARDQAIPSAVVRFRTVHPSDVWVGPERGSRESAPARGASVHPSAGARRSPLSCRQPSSAVHPRRHRGHGQPDRHEPARNRHIPVMRSRVCREGSEAVDVGSRSIRDVLATLPTGARWSGSTTEEASTRRSRPACHWPGTSVSRPSGGCVRAAGPPSRRQSCGGRGRRRRPGASRSGRRGRRRGSRYLRG